MKNIKYSKSYKDILQIKKDFYLNNKENLKKAIKINKKYSQQPKRFNCKNCNSRSLNKFIKNFNIEYLQCNNCGHLNGRYDDTSHFTKWLYQRDGGKNYSYGYEKDYLKRVKNIYLPKAKFLNDTVKKGRILEIGSGACHLLKAFENINVSAKGYEPSESLIKIGRKFLKKNTVHKLPLESINKVILKENNCNTLTMIAVLEHLNNPNIFIQNFKKSKLEYLYISVPLLSLSVLLENSFKKVFPRHLSGGHTHLYTMQSLNYFAKKFKLKIIGEWWFGTDIADLYRSLIVTSNVTNNKIYEKNVNRYFFQVLNELQNILDKNKICSEVHMIFKKN